MPLMPAVEGTLAKVNGERSFSAKSLMVPPLSSKAEPRATPSLSVSARTRV